MQVGNQRFGGPLELYVGSRAAIVDNPLQRRKKSVSTDDVEGVRQAVADTRQEAERLIPFLPAAQYVDDVAMGLC